MKKLFTEKQLAIAAVLAGPIPPGILFYLNYKRIDKDKEAYISIAATLIFTIGLFFTLFHVPEKILGKIPDSVFTAVYGLLVYLAYKFFLSNEIEERLKDGYEKASNWTLAGVCILGLGLNLIIILGLAANQPAFDGDKITFGVTKNEIYFDNENTSVDEVKKLESTLRATGFFHDDFTAAVRLEKFNSNYSVTLQVDKKLWNDEGVNDFINALKQMLELEYGAGVAIVLEDYDLGGKRYEKRI